MALIGVGHPSPPLKNYFVPYHTGARGVGDRQGLQRWMVMLLWRPMMILGVWPEMILGLRVHYPVGSLPTLAQSSAVLVDRDVQGKCSRRECRGEGRRRES